ncbi:WGR domain-containing protein [Chelativorans salis]|uniref:WGR domain-containing protein n=1 Tax=Chelativorans salis TaxID=2978478 RepID=A0ABT2LRD6_9HYPH|nr:WGR domain-containing protein [Chelativorans sp. EGI FJ00035]MCT7377106.1 WGR domain-containing protein [Chelativorans sp. EGI FJ00035]
MEPADEPLVLTRIDPARNMARFYLLSLEPTLLGQIALRRNWGRIGTWGRQRLELHDDAQAARQAQARLLAEKLRKGYRPS